MRFFYNEAHNSMRQPKQICPEEPEGQDSGEYSLRGGTWVMPSRFTDQDAQEIEERGCPCLLFTVDVYTQNGGFQATSTDRSDCEATSTYNEGQLTTR